MNKWINILDKEPDLHEFVLVCSIDKRFGKYKPISIAIMHEKRKAGDFLGFCNIGVSKKMECEFQIEEITHWMPLPKLPKAE